MAIDRAELHRALAFTDDDARALAERLRDHKEIAYLATLIDRAIAYDLDPPAGLSSRIERQIDDEAREHAEQMVDSYNRALRRFLERQDLEDPDLLARVEEWARSRQEVSAAVAGITETYSAHADATLTFFTAAGLSPKFDFGAHGPDEAPPSCPICAAIVAGNPWSVEDVVRIGIPHPACRQSWRERGVSKADFPAGYVPGSGGVAGIVGGVPLIIEQGSRDRAVDAIRSMTS